MLSMRLKRSLRPSLPQRRSGCTSIYVSDRWAELCSQKSAFSGSALGSIGSILPGLGIVRITCSVGHGLELTFPLDRPD